MEQVALPSFTTKTFPTKPENILFLDVLNFYGYLKLSRDLSEEDYDKSQLSFAQALSFMTGITEEQYLQYFPYCLDEDIPPGMTDVEQQEMLNELYSSYFICPNDKLSMVRVEAHLHNVLRLVPEIKEQSAKDYRVRIKNEKGEYEWFQLNLMLWKDFGETYELPSGPAVEVMRFSEVFENGVDPFSGDYNIDDHKNRAFGTLAYLLVSVYGEKFPMNKAERDLYIQKKQNMLLNADMSYYDVQQVCFFLSQHYSNIVAKKLLNPFGKEQALRFQIKND